MRALATPGGDGFQDCGERRTRGSLPGCAKRPSMKSLQDRVVLITGGTSGIGLALAQAFADAGAKVAVCGRDEARLSTARRAVPDALCITADVTDEAEVAAMLGAVADRFGRLDVLVNN